MDENVRIVVSAVDKASKDLQKIGKTGKTSFTELKSAVDLASMAFNKALVVGKKVFDMGKQGAQLEYTSQKFANLSRSIGEVSDALLIDLRGATQGLVSDSQLIQSATDFMSLGLANTRDEVVRLTKVAGALNMDMNQLVLTLTNQTTMRFDALGVSVDGFDERVKSLRDSGMSASDAFSEAFLRQAEEQIELLGDAADGATKDFLRMDAAVANMSDTLKRRAAPSVTAFANLVADMLTLDTEGWFKDGANAAADFLNALGVPFAKKGTEFEITKSLKSANREAREMAAIYNGDVRPAVTSLEATIRSASGAMDEQQQILDGYTTDAFKLTRQMDDLREAISGKMDDAQRDFIKNTEDLRIKTIGLKDQIEILEGKSYLTDDQKAELDGLRGELKETEGAIGELADAHEEATRRILYGMLEQKLAANGLTTEEGALLEELAGKWGLVDQGVREAQKATTEATGIMESNVANATERVGLFWDAWLALNSLDQVKDFMIRVAMETQERVSAWGGETNPYAPQTKPSKTTPQGTGKAAGGSVYAGVSYPVGERGVEMFTPATNGYITPNNQLGGGDVFAPIINIYPLPGQDENAIAAKVFAMLSRANRRGSAGLGYAGV